VVRDGKVTALFEHHTSMMSADKIRDYTQRLIRGSLTESEVLDDGGHGCIYAKGHARVSLIAVTGPRRELVSGSGWYFAAPKGNMMLMGCFGLIAAALNFPAWRGGR